MAQKKMAALDDVSQICLEAVCKFSTRLY